MNLESRKIKTFKDLDSWQKAHQLVLWVYKKTDTFPRTEVFGLTSQIRRAVVSISSNIAEGFSRNTYKDKLQFYSIALGSLSEVESQLLIAKDLEYLPETEYDQVDFLLIEVSKLLHGLIKSTKLYIQS